jgi:hypothetical protein
VCCGAENAIRNDDIYMFYILGCLLVCLEALATIVALVAVVSVAKLQLGVPKRPVYMVDFAVHKGLDDWKFHKDLFIPMSAQTGVSRTSLDMDDPARCGDSVMLLLNLGHPAMSMGCLVVHQVSRIHSNSLVVTGAACTFTATAALAACCEAEAQPSSESYSSCGGVGRRANRWTLSLQHPSQQAALNQRPTFVFHESASGGRVRNHTSASSGGGPMELVSMACPSVV